MLLVAAIHGRLIFHHGAIMWSVNLMLMLCVLRAEPGFNGVCAIVEGSFGTPCRSASGLHPVVRVMNFFATANNGTIGV